MQFFTIIWHNLWRSTRRSLLIILGVAVAIFVFVSLWATIYGITFPVREAGAMRMLNVCELARANILTSRIPLSHAKRVAAIPGVSSSTPVLSNIAVVGKDRVHIFVRGVDPEGYLNVHHLKVDPADWERFADRNDAMLVGHRLLRRMGWESGKEVEIREIGLRVMIAGIIPPQGVDLENHMLVHRSYLESVMGLKGTVSFILVEPASGVDSISLAQEIDNTLSTSLVPTKTVSSSAYAEAIIRDFMGFVRYLRVMVIITIFIAMLTAANAIGIGIRERTREIGMLKAIGFTPSLILFIVLAESVILSLIGGAIGIIAAFLTVGSESANLAGLMLSTTIILEAVGFAVLIGLAGGFFSALYAARLNTIDALRVI